MSEPSPGGGKAVLGWLTFAALCLALEVMGVVDGLALPVPLIIALVLARAIGARLAIIAGALRALALGLVVLCVLSAAAVLRWRIGLLDMSPSALAVVLGGLGGVFTIAAWRRARAVLLRPFGLDPDSAVHLVSGLAFVLALLFTAVSFIDLQGEPPEPVPLGVGDTLVALVGDGALALAGVGFLQTRGLSATLARLAVRPIRPRALMAVVVIAAGFHGAVWVLERMESVFLPGLAALEDRFDYQFVGLPPVLGGVLLSIGVGVGEELLFRGAMQPRFGIVPTAILFAAFHVQYQLPGIVMIFLVGVGIGLIKNRTSTTFTAAVHVLYDIGAFLLPDV
jgi:membrane protease YdiL (CAAX protease family)